MEVVEVSVRDEQLIQEVFKVWHSSVLATHDFLTSDDINDIAKYVPMALKEVPTLVIVKNDDQPVAFIGIDGCKLEMLFVAGDVRGQGIGKELLKYGIKKYGVKELSVNEQNPQALHFYEHMGFVVVKRSELDEQGNPFPILLMHLKED